MLCLTRPTSDRWLLAALANLDAVLVDHAHCEMKAASNALSLAVRASQTPGVVSALVSKMQAVVDRLLVAALIEARSCERFRLLSEALKDRGPADLAALYEELLASEARHFRTFVDLARQVAQTDEAWVDERLRQVARLEGDLASRLEGAPAIHG
jgi:tRNA-(ms[2]io[6]A)-hydroxylase